MVSYSEAIVRDKLLKLWKYGIKDYENIRDDTKIFVVFQRQYFRPRWLLAENDWDLTLYSDMEGCLQLLEETHEVSLEGRQKLLVRNKTTWKPE